MKKSRKIMNNHLESDEKGYLTNEIIGWIWFKKGLKVKNVDISLFDNIKNLKILENPDYHKSLLFKENDSVIKICTGMTSYRNLRDIENSYLNAWKENPDLFPEVSKIGEGEIELYDGKKYDMTIIKQKYVKEKTLKSLLKIDYDDAAIESCLDKWDRLINRHKSNPPEKLLKLFKEVNENDFSSFKKITDKYYDGFPNLQASFAIEKLKRKFEFLNGLELPEVDINVSKIVGDISPKHLIVNGNYLSVDVEKYGFGDPSRDLATFIQYFIGKDQIKKALKQLSDRYNHELLKNSFLSLIGDKARTILYPRGDDDLNKNIRDLKKNLGIYPLMKEYWI